MGSEVSGRNTAVDASPSVPCLGCGYELAGLGPGVCPECGLRLGPYEVAIAGLRASLMTRWRRGRWARIGRAGGVILVYAVAMAGLANDWGAGWAVLAALGVLVAGSPMAAWVILRLARRADRRAAFVVWVRTSWLLHAPWLVLGPIGVVTLVLALLDRWVTRAGYAVPMAVGVICVVLVPSLVLVCWLLQMDEMKRLNAELGVRLGFAGLMLRLLAAVVVVASGIVAIKGGAMALELMNGYFHWTG